MIHTQQSPLQGVGGKNVYSDISFVNMFYGASPILFEFAKSNRENPTDAESYLWNYLSKSNQNGFRFRRQHPVKYFIADFYCHRAKLIIEVDGGYHDIPEQYQYDRNRDYELEELGIKVLHFTNEQIFNTIDSVLKTINSFLTPKSPKGDFGQ
ncbi:MAG: endonuclease domain-containing protein [Candidatus Symbiothrix sp.]|jgi:cyclase|nr:endonuclease domain-containing protein [Candidatus Symbiothrix sp.]